MSTYDAPRTSYARALAGFDPSAILATLSDEVTIQVAVHDQPLLGLDTARFLFDVLTRELAPFIVIAEVVEQNTSVVLFDTAVRGQAAHGLNLVSYRPDGLVGELTVFFRPLAALQLIAEVIGAHMATRFGPSPEGLPPS